MMHPEAAMFYWMIWGFIVAAVLIMVQE